MTFDRWPRSPGTPQIAFKSERDDVPPPPHYGVRRGHSLDMPSDDVPSDDVHDGDTEEFAITRCPSCAGMTAVPLRLAVSKCEVCLEPVSLAASGAPR